MRGGGGGGGGGLILGEGINEFDVLTRTSFLHPASHWGSQASKSRIAIDSYITTLLYYSSTILLFTILPYYQITARSRLCRGCLGSFVLTIIVVKEVFAKATGLF